MEFFHWSREAQKQMNVVEPWQHMVQVSKLVLPRIHLAKHNFSAVSLCCAVQVVHGNPWHDTVPWILRESLLSRSSWFV